MALTQLYTAVAGHVITAARWNNEFGNIYNNGASLVFPLTGAVSFGSVGITSVGSFTLSLSNAVLAGTTDIGLLINGSLPTGGAKGVEIALVTVPATGESSYGLNVIPTLTEFSAGVHALLAGINVAPVVTAGAGTTTTLASIATGALTAQAGTTNAAAVYIGSAPTGATNNYALWVDNGNVQFDGNLAVSGNVTITGSIGVEGVLTQAGNIFGLRLSNNVGDATNDIDIAVGEATSVNATPASRIRMVLASALTKRLDASWVTGTNQGGLSSSLAIANTTYHVHLIRVAGVDDIGFDTSATATNLITDHGATSYRRIGSIVRAGAAIRAFVQTGDYFRWSAPVSDYVASSPGASAVTRTLTVPLGLEVFPLHVFRATSSGVGGVTQHLVTSLDETDTAPSITLFTINLLSDASSAQAAGTYLNGIKTNTSGQIRTRASSAAGTIVHDGVTFGWIDTRGRDA
jgi:hypothetical protein